MTRMIKVHGHVLKQQPNDGYYYTCIDCGIEVFPNDKAVWIVSTYYRKAKKMTIFYLSEVDCNEWIIREIIK